MPEIAALQPQLVQQFSQIVANQRLSQAYIFNGPSGTGKAQLAEWLAMRLFCTNVQAGQPCGECPECQRVRGGNHPDVVWLTSDAKSIKVDDIRALKAEMSKSGVEGTQRVFIVTDADKLTAGAANSLLKFYEEPVPGMTIILTTTAKNQLLPTILSRAQVINFPAPARAQVQVELEAAGVEPRLAAVAAHLTVDVTAGVAMAEDERFAARLKAVLTLVGKLTQGDAEAFVLVQTTLVPLAKTLPEQQQLLAMLALAYADALNAHYQVPLPGAFGDDATIAALAGRASRQLSDGLAHILATQIRLGQNVTFQSALEALVLQLL
ncbi:DNA polymerase III subunit delta' [Lacticaseibacillus absianus]|uniref:DNA polymerase III subunit delta' n=1 Tax=Lacticaseibacillus absianus TaxID=2729623 RepID=UPI0015C98C97|nr:DNA polymerase III subunit delta' [Lacticaseibacillus absianus]